MFVELSSTAPHFSVVSSQGVFTALFTLYARQSKLQGVFTGILCACQSGLELCKQLAFLNYVDLTGQEVQMVN